MEDESNFLLLKVDVHKLWDQRQFTVVPTTVNGEKEKVMWWVAYVLRRPPSQEVITGPGRGETKHEASRTVKKVVECVMNSLVLLS